MTPEKLAELEALEAAATPGPWPIEEDVEDDEPHYLGGGMFAAMGPVHEEEACHEEGKQAECAICDADDCIANMKAEADQRLIHALRNNAPALFAAIRGLWQQNASHRKYIAEYKRLLSEAQHAAIDAQKQAAEARQKLRDAVRPLRHVQETLTKTLKDIE